MNDIINFFETSQIEYLNKKDKSYLKNTSQFFTPYDTACKMISTIDFNNYKNIDVNKCIKCCSCIKRCPFNSKEITHMAFKNMQNMLETNFAHIERNPEIFMD